MLRLSMALSYVSAVVPVMMCHEVPRACTVQSLVG